MNCGMKMDEIVEVEGNQISFISSVLRERGQVCLLPPERIFGPCDAVLTAQHSPCCSGYRPSRGTPSATLSALDTISITSTTPMPEADYKLGRSYVYEILSLGSRSNRFDTGVSTIVSTTHGINHYVGAHH